MAIRKAIALAFTAFLAAFLPSAAMAGESAQACYAAGSVDLARQADPAAAAAWDCTSNKPTTAEYAARKFELGEGSDFPRYLATRIGGFERLDLMVVDASGTWHRASYTMDEVEPVSDGPFFIAALPVGEEAPQTVIAQFSALSHNPTLSAASLEEADPGTTPERMRELLFIAALFGMLLIPIIFDLAFWRALRQSFPLWHLLLTACFGMMIGLRSGLVHLYFDLDLATTRVLLTMNFGLVCAVGLMFTRSFAEAGKLPRWLYRVIPWVAVWALMVSAIHAARFEILQPLGGDFHSYGLLPVLAAYFGAIGFALYRGSRSIRYQVVGLAPIFVAVFVQLATDVVSLTVPTSSLTFLYLGVLTETIATAMGVTDRFLALRRERDSAVARSDAMARLTELDPLTGLMNRRAIDSRFRELHQEGYRTFAVLDLDKFKAVNDTLGHATGDNVLVSVAGVLREDPTDMIAIRIGGEEFLIILRGEGAVERAEQLREAIPGRIARDVSGLSAPLTASMGLLVLPPHSKKQVSFTHAYARADKLLYEAKASGRNRMVMEYVDRQADAPSSWRARAA
ncbi:diguanylate cyclase [Erythrobacter sp. HKB08]|uniref:GGDEF domain-containing protein n=1 Tax=Erythrobacter sp. HKB08 TaxID=2502843 RepID=UPI0013E8B037|nr:diguanylate cyclase [Erythrobacter sp. HKB08]